LAHTSRVGGTARYGKGLLVREREALFIISVAARLVDMHPSTLRKYERVGFLEPSRLGGKLRLYSPEDITRLRQIKYLVEEHGINLAGIELALEITQCLLRLRETFETGAAGGRTSRIDEARRALLDGLLEQLGVEPEETNPSSPGTRQTARYAPNVTRDSDERVGGRTR
jgi:MerR family transcriptional regulator, heat shock protein HspR